MAKDKVTGVGTVVEIDFTGAGTAFDAIECVQNLTPPPKTREPVESSCLEEAEVSYSPGQAEKTDFVFLAVWQPGDTIEDKFDTAFDNADIVNVRITYPHTTAQQEETFDGWLAELAPQNINRSDVIARQVTIRRTTAITRAAPTP